jgi:hypothetical protein
MKNIHVLPTDKPSRLRIGSNFNFVLGLIQSDTVSKNDSYTNRHIYITSNEEIKVGDSVISSFNLWEISGNLLPVIGKIKEIKKDGYLIEYYNTYLGENSSEWEFGHSKKIILTTDQDLIKDGVQAIYDDFLEWFIKNPSCEEGEVDKNWNYPLDKSWEYKIIIPKAEQKQHLIDIMRGDEELGLYEEPKQETLEEAALNYSKQFLSTQEYDFKEGAKWQQERMYSKEDLRTAWMAAKNSSDFNEWFEQYKKK